MNYFDEYESNEELLKQTTDGIVNIKENICYINEQEVENNRGLNGDNVFVKDKKIIGIKERINHKIVGFIDLNSKYKIIIPEFNKKGKNKIYHIFQPMNRVYPNFYVSLNAKHYTGTIYVYIEFTRWNKNSKYPHGCIIDIIGNIGNYENEINVYLYYFDVYRKKTNYIKNDYDKHIKEIDELQDKSILSEYSIFSIDPKGSKDLDDAFHYNMKEDTFELGIHIACPYYFLSDSHYLDECFKNITTIYHYKNIHMLEEHYSNTICSLVERKKRKALSFILTFDKDLNLINKELKLTTVYIERNYNYDEFFEKYSKKMKDKINFIDFSKLFFKKELDSHELVEFWMIYANRLIVEYLIENNYKNIIVRSHIKNNINITSSKNEYLNKILSYEYENSASYQLLDISKKEEFIHSKFGTLYSHFTSPIRRVIDFYIQAQILGKIEVEKNILEKYIFQVNMYQKKLKKFYNYQKKIKFIYDHKEDKITCEAYVLKIKNNYLKLHIKEHDFQIKYYLFPYKFMKSIEIKEKLIEDRITQIIYKIDNKESTYHLYELLKIEMYFFQFEINIEDKIKLKII
jgi:exoribonuclease R